MDVVHRREVAVAHEVRAAELCAQSRPDLALVREGVEGVVGIEDAGSR